jgi:hypothetical protein
VAIGIDWCLVGYPGVELQVVVLRSVISDKIQVNKKKASSTRTPDHGKWMR